MLIVTYDLANYDLFLKNFNIDPAKLHFDVKISYNENTQEATGDNEKGQDKSYDFNLEASQKKSSSAFKKATDFEIPQVRTKPESLVAFQELLSKHDADTQSGLRKIYSTLSMVGQLGISIISLKVRINYVDIMLSYALIPASNNLFYTGTCGPSRG